MPRVTKKNEILLSQLFYVATSQIPGAGRGVFAKVDIPRKTFMGEYEGPLVRTQSGMESDYTFGLFERGKQVEVRDGGTILKYLNHEGRWPNAKFKGYTLSAVRDIKAGDEVTFHYGKPLCEIVASHKPK